MRTLAPVMLALLLCMGIGGSVVGDGRGFASYLKHNTNEASSETNEVWGALSGSLTEQHLVNYTTMTSMTIEPMPMAYAGEPVSANFLIILTNEAYVAAYNEERKCAEWVAYRFVGSGWTNAAKRPSRFVVDERTVSKVSHNDYTHSGYDRGHMAPNSAIGRYYGSKAQMETFLMSNVIPQKPNLNQRSWRELEARETDMAVSGVVWVVTGPVFDKFRECLPSGVEIPDWCYKIIVFERTGELRVTSYMMPRDTASGAKPEEFLTTVDAIEKATGLDFFHELDDEQEDKLESK